MKLEMKFFFLLFFLTQRTDVPLCFCLWHFRKSLNSSGSHSDLWRLIALISLKLTARTKLDSQEAVCVHCSWQFLIRATLFPTPFHPAPVINPAHHLTRYPPTSPPPACQHRGSELTICLQMSYEQKWTRTTKRRRGGGGGWKSKWES